MSAHGRGTAQAQACAYESGAPRSHNDELTDIWIWRAGRAGGSPGSPGSRQAPADQAGAPVLKLNFDSIFIL